MFHITFWCFMFKEFCFVLYAKNMSVCFVIEVVIGWNQLLGLGFRVVCYEIFESL